MEKIILDTNILIEILKNNQNIIDFLENSPHKNVISAVSEMELYYGALNKAELKTLQAFIALFEVIPIQPIISNVATQLILKYAKSHQLSIPDSLIAATAKCCKLKLFTLNKKDFKYIKEIQMIEENAK